MVISGSSFASAFPLALLLVFVSAHAAPLVWIGAVTDSSFRIHLDVQSSITQILLSTDPTFNTTSQPPREARSPDSLLPPPYEPLRAFTYTGLDPLTRYHIALKTSSSSPAIPVASVRTFPTAGTPTDFAFAFSSCQYLASLDDAFRDIRARFNDADTAASPLPFFFLHMGDIVYSDITRNDVSLYESALRDLLTRPRIHSVFSAMPVPYMYDDHDYGANNAGFSSPSREAALRNYRTMVPAYATPSDDASYHAFTLGAARFIITDLRAQAGRQRGSALGATQRAWLLEELGRADEFRLVVWMSSKPWIAREQEGDDSWGGNAEERTVIANRIAELRVQNLVVVAGDSHMLAADDGSHADYADDGGSGFPVFQAAPLGNVGTGKGGPYSEGCRGFRFFSNLQYGILNVTRMGEEDGPCVEFSGYKAGQMEERLIGLKKCGVLGGVRGEGGQAGSCGLPLFPRWVWAPVVLGFILLVGMCGGCVWACCACRKRRKKASFSFHEEVWDGGHTDSVVADAGHDGGYAERRHENGVGPVEMEGMIGSSMGESSDQTPLAAGERPAVVLRRERDSVSQLLVHDAAPAAAAAT